MKTHEKANCGEHNYPPQQVGNKTRHNRLMKKTRKTKANTDRCERNHFIGKEKLDLRKKMMEEGNFMPKMIKKNHSFSLTNKGLKERIEGEAARFPIVFNPKCICYIYN